MLKLISAVFQLIMLGEFASSSAGRFKSSLGKGLQAENTFNARSKCLKIFKIVQYLMLSFYGGKVLRKLEIDGSF